MPFQANHYLSVSSRERAWGLYVTGVGHAIVEPHGAYPPMPHPAGYDFQWSRGRILDEFAILHLVNGGGSFESANQPILPIAAGDCVILFPGEWHRYKPDEGVGWEEYWITFQGRLAESWMEERFIWPEAPVFSLGNEDSLASLFGELLRMTDPKSSRRALESAALCHLLVARLLSNPEKTAKHF
jgi:hypothetical protein